MKHLLIALILLVGATPALADKTLENRPDFPPPRKSDIRDDLRSLFGLAPRTVPGAGGFQMKPSAAPLAPSYGKAPGVVPTTTTPALGRTKDSRCSRSALSADEMRELQRLLNFIWGSEAAGAGRPDGRCGPRTAGSVEALQRAHGRDADGVPTTDVLALAQEIVIGASPTRSDKSGSVAARRIGH